MPRVVDHLEGLALTGSGAVGPLRFPIPHLLEARLPGDPSSGLATPRMVVEGADPTDLGRRTLVLRQAEGEVRLDLPTWAPEVSGIPGGADEVAPKAWRAHLPLDEATWSVVQAARPDLLILGNARALFDSGRPFIQALGEIRRRLGGAPLLWAPRVALPHRLALLVYFGVDLVDTTEGRWRTADGTRLDASLGAWPTSSPPGSGACSCSDCTTHSAPGPAHVYAAFAEELARVRAAATAGRLRELVESRLAVEPALAELLRYADEDIGGLLEERTPVIGSEQHVYVHRESLRRPEVVRYLDRVLHRYRPPPSKEVLLLLPCSKTKPYRNSPSHRRYLRALEGLPHLARLHVASITSPLGAVPRELEDVYPARQYDIPVTGSWDEEERRRAVAVVDHLLREGKYRSVVCHLDPEEYAFLRSSTDRSPSTWSSPDDRTLAPENLDRLRRATDEALAGSGPIRGGPLGVVREELREIAAYQFGRAGAERLFEPPVRLAGRPWFQRLVDAQGRDLASWRDERGLFHLTVAGARRLGPVGPWVVTVAPEVPLLGDLFTPGVKDADPELRVGDAVVLVRDGEVVGVGEAELPGSLMTQLAHGRAVEVRHRAHDAGANRPGDRHPDDTQGGPTRGPVV